MEIIRKSVLFELKGVDMEEGEFTGHAAVFNNIDSQKDIILPGAFKKTLKESGGKVPILWQHNPDEPIGLPIKMEEDEKGLFVHGKLSMTQLGKDALILLRDKIVKGLSIGFSVVKDTFDKDKGIRQLHEVKLWEFSLVTWPANARARVLRVKNIGEIDIESILERLALLEGKQEPQKKQDVDPEQIQSAKEAITGLKNLFK